MIIDEDEIRLLLNAPAAIKAAREFAYGSPAFITYEHRQLWEKMEAACKACEPVALTTPTDEFEMVVGRLEELIRDLKKARG